MKLKKRLLAGSKLYVIIDRKICARKPLASLASQVASCGADIVQLRDKESPKKSVLKAAYAIRKTLSNKKTIFIVNDYIDVAKITDADGLHLGQDDCSISTARRILGKDKIIGVSCKNVAQAKTAQKQGADYIGVGPIFATPTKPQAKPVGLSLIPKIKNSVSIPFFVLGGINKSNLKDIRAYGAQRIAVSSAVCVDRNTRVSTRQLAKLLH
jgi:thiamine-phosphate pyrophosphorylase